MSSRRELLVVINRIENEGFMQGFVVLVSAINAKALFADLGSSVSFYSQHALVAPHLTTSIWMRLTFFGLSKSRMMLPDRTVSLVGSPGRAIEGNKKKRPTPTSMRMVAMLIIDMQAAKCSFSMHRNVNNKHQHCQHMYT